MQDSLGRIMKWKFEFGSLSGAVRPLRSLSLLPDDQQIELLMEGSDFGPHVVGFLLLGFHGLDQPGCESGGDHTEESDAAEH